MSPLGRTPLVMAPVIERVGPGELVGRSWMFPSAGFDGRALEPVGAVSFDAQCLRAEERNTLFRYLLMKHLPRCVGQAAGAQAPVVGLLSPRG